MYQREHGLGKLGAPGRSHIQWLHLCALAEAVARAIARELNLEYEFLPRQATGSGMSSIKETKKR